MLSIFQARFQRLEQALNTLVESIAAYNPSVAAADELVAADDELSESLEQLAVHHANYARILSLRQTADALDDKIKSTLRTLADTRKDLLNIPSVQVAPGAREVQVDELLSYAKFISKTTVPPTFRQQAIESTDTPSAQQQQQQPQEEAQTTQITNGMATPAANGEAPPTQQQQQQQQQQQSSDPSAETKAISTLDQETKAMLDPLSQLPFEPWPSQVVIRAGALGQIQLMLEEGRDPSTVLSQEEQEEKDRVRAEEEERERLEMEERERRRRESYAARAGGAVGGGRQGPTEDVFDPDEF